MSVEKVAGNRALIAESPTWDQRTASLLWVDIPRGEIHRYRPDGDEDSVVFVAPTSVGAVVTRRSGGLAVAAGKGFAIVDEEAGSWRPIAAVERGDRMNEARCDPAGRLWGGTMTLDQRPSQAALYRLDQTGSAELMLDQVGLSNGLAWSPDGTRMYYADTMTERVDVFDYELETGTPSNQRPLIDLHDVDGRPDGMTVDAEGGIWVTMARGGAIRRYSSTGSLDEVLSMPVPTVTSCAFGGPDLADLYVTTLCIGLGETDLAEHPGAGSVFCVPGIGVRGIAEASFLG